MSAEYSTLDRWLRRAASHPRAGMRYLDRRERETWVSWEEVYRRAQAIAGSLQAEGLRRGDRVAIVFPTCPEYVDAFFGTLLAGAVPVPLYPPVRLGRLDEYQNRTASMVQAVRARIVLADRRVQRIVGPAIRRARPDLGCRTLDELRPGLLADCRNDPDDLALVQFSSGTTVEPKPVALSHRAVAAQVALLNRFWPDAQAVQHSGVSWLPLYHDMGLIGCIFPALERISTLTLIPPELFVARPSVWLRTISRYRATISPAPSFAYGLCVEKIRDEELEGVDLSCWRVALNGAETVAPESMRSFIRRFSRFGLRPEALTPVYGLSEAALAVTFSALDRGFVSRRFDRALLAEAGRAVEQADGIEIVSVGRPLPEFTLRIVDGSGARLPEGRAGRVLVQGPSLMDGYLDRPEATAAVLRDGWLDTGDLGFTFDGELYLTGRAKDVLILRGRNHAPEEVERALSAVEGVRTGCTVAVSWYPEGATGERLLVFAETPRGASPRDPAALRDRCAEAVLRDTGLVADEVVLLDAGTLPRTSSGKLRRGDTLARHLQGLLQPPGKVNALSLARAVTRSSFAYALMKWKDGEAPAS